MAIIQIAGLDVEYQREGAGPDLLLLHSLLTEMSVFDEVLPGLTRTHSVTRINLPGFGASTAAVLNSVADHADHVARAMDALGLAPATDVFGNGFGAFVALELAIRHGSRIGRLMVADTLAAFPVSARVPFRGMAGKVRAGGMQAVLDTAIGRMFPPAFQTSRPDVITARKVALSGVDPQCFERACLALAQMDLQPLLGGIRNRTLVMCGSLDLTTPPALALQAARAIPGAQYREIADCGHCPMLEQPAALVEMMEDFLAAA